MIFPQTCASRRPRPRKASGHGGPSAAIASRWCCKAAARSAPIRPASIRRCTRRGSSRIGCRVSRSAPSIRRSSPAIRAAEDCAAADVLGAHHRSQDLAVHARRRRVPQSAQCDELLAHHGPRAAGIFRAAFPQSVAEPRRRAKRDQLLRYRAVAGNADRAGGFFSDQRTLDALFGRRGQCAHRQFRLFRQCGRSRSSPSTSWPAARCRRPCRW